MRALLTNAVLPRWNVYGIGGLLLGVLPVQVGGLPGDDAALDGDARMRARLAELAESYLETDVYCGTAEARALRDELERLSDAGPPARLWNTLHQVAFHELRLGDAPAAV
ncbi:MAG TPA: hypothetical protein VMT18_03405, partial [Planctomycetota bacterium]|nr:hypothetical protein [Planctomycetota bacterium]